MVIVALAMRSHPALRNNCQYQSRCCVALQLGPTGGQEQYGVLYLPNFLRKAGGFFPDSWGVGYAPLLCVRFLYLCLAEGGDRAVRQGPFLVNTGYLESALGEGTHSQRRRSCVIISWRGRVQP